MAIPQHPGMRTDSGIRTAPSPFRAGDPLEKLLTEIAANAAVTMTHPESRASCGFCVVTNTRMAPLAASNSMARYLDHAQRRTGQGPGWDAALTHEPLYATDTSTETRWPGYLQVVRHTPIRSIFTIPFDINEESTGVMSLYSPLLDAFPHPLSARALHYVEQAASMIRPPHSTRLPAGIHQNPGALPPGTGIAVALGILMERHGCSQAQALALLQQPRPGTTPGLEAAAARIIDSVREPSSPAR